MLLKEACVGSIIHDLAHFSNHNCSADCLTKSSAKEDNWITAVKTVRLLEVDVHPKLQDSHGGTRPSCLHGVEHSITRIRTMFFL